MNSTTLRGVFPEPKPVPKRNFIKENVRHIKQMQGILQNSGFIEGRPERARSISRAPVKSSQNIAQTRSMPASQKPFRPKPLEVRKGKQGFSPSEPVFDLEKQKERGVQTEAVNTSGKLSDGGVIKYPSPHILRTINSRRSPSPRKDFGYPQSRSPPRDRGDACNITTNTSEESPRSLGYVSSMSHIEVVTVNLNNHPHCPHGPTVLFSRASDGKHQRFFACAACRDRKNCSFYLPEEDKDNVDDAKKARWKNAKDQFIKGVDHRKAFVKLSKVKQALKLTREYCHTCGEFILGSGSKHLEHKVESDIGDFALAHPTEFLQPLDNAKNEAQFLFSATSVEAIVKVLQEQKFRNIICMGAPRVHEYLRDNCLDMNSILLDIDRRYHSFFGPLEFCWYNMFNHYFFLPSSEQNFEDFLTNDGGEGMVLVTDPPFGGRVELLAQTIRTIAKKYQSLNGVQVELPVMFIFPYFMEPQILNSLPEFSMLDYKVDYVNHPLFQDGAKGRKLGSPVRIFTNIDPRAITLPADEGYKHCSKCNRWVSAENKHCEECDSCTSKDGRTYEHCNLCKRCVKPTWNHCAKCDRCAQLDHKCGELVFAQTCFHCKERGHKKNECPKVNHEELHRKRKMGVKTKVKKLKKCKV